MWAANLSGPEFPLKELSHTNINQVVSACMCVWVGSEEVQTARGGSLAAAKRDIKLGAAALSEERVRLCGGSGGLGVGVGVAEK